MTGERATKKQQILLEFVDQFIGEHDYGPSYREIMSALDYKSVSTVAAHVEALIAKGFLERSDGSARSLRVIKTSLAAQVPAAVSPKQALTAKLDELLNGLPDTAEDIAALTRALRIFGHETSAQDYEAKVKEAEGAAH